MRISFISELLLGIKCAFQKPVTLDKNTILKKSQHNCKYLYIDPTKCIKCKSCMYICPNKCIQILDASMQKDKSFNWEKTKCANCGLCEKSCPKKAISWTKD